MNKKLFAAGNFAIAFVFGLICMVSSFSSFSNVVLTEAGEDIAAGVFFLLFSLVFLALAVAGVALLIVSFIRKKEFKVPFVAIVSIAIAGVFLLGYGLMVTILDIKTAVNWLEHVGEETADKYNTYYLLRGITALWDMLTIWCIGLVSAALAVLSIVNFKFKKKNKAPEQVEEKPAEPVEEKPAEEAKPAEQYYLNQKQHTPCVLFYYNKIKRVYYSLGGINNEKRFSDNSD